MAGTSARFRIVSSTGHDFDLAGRAVSGSPVPVRRGATRPRLEMTSSCAANVRSFGDLGIFFRPKNHLGETFAIAQIDEDDSAMIAREWTQPASLTCSPILAARAGCSDECDTWRRAGCVSVLSEESGSSLSPIARGLLTGLRVQSPRIAECREATLRSARASLRGWPASSFSPRAIHRRRATRPSPRALRRFEIACRPLSAVSG